MNKRNFCVAGVSLAGSQLIAACSTRGIALTENMKTSPLPIIFVHGNGDNASIWQTVLWRFESAGWPATLLRPIDFRIPLALSDDTVPQAGRSSSSDQRRALGEFVESVLRSTGATKVFLVGNSRGGYAIRDYVRNGGGQSKVEAVVLGGTPNQGIWRGSSLPNSFLPNSEFNATGPFLTALNSPQGPDGSQVTPNVRFLTLRSDNNDKFAQPKGTWVGQPTMDTGISFDSPELRGAKNLVLAGRDHREVSFHGQAFAPTWEFLAGKLPLSTSIAKDASSEGIRLSGRVLGMQGAFAVNLGLQGASVSLYKVDEKTGKRLSPFFENRRVSEDGGWGDVNVLSSDALEFLVQADGFASTHIYRSAFPRSSNVVHLRPIVLTEAEKRQGAVLVMTRPRGYFGLGRDQMSFNGAPLPGVNPGVAGVSLAKLMSSELPLDPVIAQFNQERIAMQAWSAKDNHVGVAELTF